MARPVPFHPDPYDPREALRARIERAPMDHAEAVLAAYDLLQQLHQRGILEVASTALSASDEVMQKVVDMANAPESIRALRNLVVVSSVVRKIDPQVLYRLVQGIPDGLATAIAQSPERVTIWGILRRALSRDTLRGLAATIAMLASLGRQLNRDTGRAAVE